jgi:hypothetical protein
MNFIPRRTTPNADIVTVRTKFSEKDPYRQSALCASHERFHRHFRYSLSPFGIDTKFSTAILHLEAWALSVYFDAVSRPRFCNTRRYVAVQGRILL